MARLDHLLDGFAVATLDEAIELRELMVATPIMVLSEFNHPSQIALFRRYRLQPVVHRKQQLEWLEKTVEQFSSTGRKPAVALSFWLKFDTGMNRLGMPPDEAETIIARAEALEHMTLIGVMSHLASADTPKCCQNARQLESFAKIGGNRPFSRSLANSASLTDQQISIFNLVRAGIMLYGVAPLAGQSSGQLDLWPAMQFESRIIDIKSVGKGQPVGYGASWTAQRHSRIGIVGCGYADGYPRLASNRGHVVVRNESAAVVGKVSMDTLAIDLTDIPGAEVGDTAELWGRRLAVTEVAEWAETIPYEILCQISTRVPRIPIA